MSQRHNPSALRKFRKLLERASNRSFLDENQNDSSSSDSSLSLSDSDHSTDDSEHSADLGSTMSDSSDSPSPTCSPPVPERTYFSLRRITRRGQTPPVIAVDEGGVDQPAAAAEMLPGPPPPVQTEDARLPKEKSDGPAKRKGKTDNLLKQKEKNDDFPKRKETDVQNNFECVVCLENLANPTSLGESAHNSQEQTGGDAVVATSGAAAAARARVTAAAKKKALEAIDHREIASTNCGHIFHKYCITKWFNLQGKKTCPSCRKAVGTKLQRLFPTGGQEQHANEFGMASGGGGEGDANNLEPVAGPSREFGGPTEPRTGIANGCQNSRCADVVVIHDTLVSDFNEMREAYFTIREDLDIRTAENASLTESVTALTRENLELKAAAAERDADQGGKRRRQR